jgi:hypothetical protein
VNEFLIYLILPAAPDPGVTQSLTEMSMRKRKIMFLGSRARPVLRADNLTTIREPAVSTVCESQHLTSLWPPGPITGPAFYAMLSDVEGKARGL